MFTENELATFFFMKRTDRKSIYTQISELVKTAQEVAEQELNQRRERLRTMLEHEDKIYEEEFANKVKSRIDEDIQHRKDALFNIKEERKRLEKEFLERKTIQQQFESCYEIREALRRKETLQTKEVQLEQIVEKERAQLRERQLDDYWCKVRDARTQRYDERQADENKKKCDIKRSMRCVLEQQMEMHKRDEEHQRELKRAEAMELNKVMEEIRLENFDRLRMGLPKETLAYREELLGTIADNKAKRDAEECERIEEHRQLMRDVAREQQEYSAALLQRKRAVYNATMEYLDYARRMRKLEKDTQNMRDARIDDLCHVDICTKSNIKRELQRKAEIAALCYAELRRQICEEYERRLRDIQELREPKIIENRFARPEKTRADIMAERRKMRAGLDEQLIENARVHAEEEAKYNADLKLAINDPEFCTELAKKYLSAGIDYLPPHANWLIYACPQKQFVAKRHAPAAGGERGEDIDDTCIKPCGCKARTGLECTHHNWSAHKRGAHADGKRRLELESC